ncbi:peptide chain release factor 2 [Candidatus Phytoplasma oryzae]|uniref:Peptide chain release factor 2 n=1 Tax=Candidatus Phytoplasma oryzae TaxID=203274 RepID=A0A139JQS1_9MOLU|nr:peptide chain release factor 2 [Candidatus Phytoplasma oryzae]KXT29184.1 peptide chain release factor 2 [Candidatus Phytoplasma oryzae]KXT29200.1 peptide chain release factor 2 [Candidatus Phytoplasma oryzae]RAM57741.1 peptide chain release factor 2 [Candidatus Phytoplasma oryzae]
MERYEINKILENLKVILSNLEIKINLKQKKKKIDELNRLMLKPFFWQQNNKDVIQLTQQFSKLQNQCKKFINFKTKYDELESLFNIIEENNEDFFYFLEELKLFQKEIKKLEIELILNQPYDENNAILILHPGAGGTESQDWCEMLFRMYQKYSQKKNFKVKILYYQPGEEAGLKSVSLLIQGLYAFGYLKAERGIHRLVRISPFDSNSRRHTSFVSCEVLPEINDEIKINIKDEELRIDVFRSSGAGGQHVNTTDSAVRITHLPTNIVVSCQNERSQIKNREKALQILKTRLLQLALEKQKENEKLLKKGQKDISWGSQIRSYVFHPYQIVKDHRTNFEVSQVNLMMDGSFLDDFINAFLIKNNNV